MAWPWKWFSAWVLTEPSIVLRNEGRLTALAHRQLSFVGQVLPVVQGYSQCEGPGALGWWFAWLRCEHTAASKQQHAAALEER